MINLAYDDRGSGEPVVFIAGHGGAGRKVTGLLPERPTVSATSPSAERCTRSVRVPSLLRRVSAPLARKAMPPFTWAPSRST